MKFVTKMVSAAGVVFSVCSYTFIYKRSKNEQLKTSQKLARELGPIFQKKLKKLRKKIDS